MNDGFEHCSGKNCPMQWNTIDVPNCQLGHKCQYFATEMANYSNKFEKALREECPELDTVLKSKLGECVLDSSKTIRNFVGVALTMAALEQIYDERGRVGLRCVRENFKRDPICFDGLFSDFVDKKLSKIYNAADENADENLKTP